MPKMKDWDRFDHGSANDRLAAIVAKLGKSYEVGSSGPGEITVKRNGTAVYVRASRKGSETFTVKATRGGAVIKTVKLIKHSQVMRWIRMYTAKPKAAKPVVKPPAPLIGVKTVKVNFASMAEQICQLVETMSGDMSNDDYRTFTRVLIRKLEQSAAL